MSITLTALIIAGAFSYGVCVGRFKLPPYYGIKRIIRSFDNQSQGHSSIYLDRTSLFERTGKRADVVMVGDSITSRAEWHELLDGVSVVNRGIDGDTTAGILKRTGSIFSVKPGVVFLMAGINDISQRVPAGIVVENIDKFITVAKENHTSVVVQSILLTCDDDSYAGFNVKARRLNGMIAEVCRERGVLFLDINPILDNYRVNKLNPEYTNDGIHLNGAGYALWAKVIGAYLHAPNKARYGGNE